MYRALGQHGGQGKHIKGSIRIGSSIATVSLVNLILGPGKLGRRELTESHCVRKAQRIAELWGLPFRASSPQIPQKCGIPEIYRHVPT